MTHDAFWDPIAIQRSVSGGRYGWGTFANRAPDRAFSKN